VQKLISGHSTTHRISGKVNSGNLKQFDTCTSNFSFKINFSFLIQSLQGNFHKLLKLKTTSAQFSKSLQKYICTKTEKKQPARKTVQVVVWIHTTAQICCTDPYDCTYLLYGWLLYILSCFSSLLNLLLSLSDKNCVSTLYLDLSLYF
jgi:hypothetical protein